MRFDIEFTDQSEREFLELDNSIKKRVKKSFEERLSKDPIGYGKPLKYQLKGLRSLRISKFRILYTVNEENKIVTIQKIGIRKNVYG